MATGCDAELPPECTEPDPGDLDGYCIVGDHDGEAAARADMEACIEDDDELEPATPEEVAEGPGSCGDVVTEAVLAAEQQAYEDCWQLAYDATYRSPSSTECP